MKLFTLAPVILQTFIVRAFVSVDITDSMVSDAISEMQKNSDLAGAVRVENMHYTLMFLGQVEDSKMGDIKRALESVEFDAFEVRCKGLGMFASKGSKIIWVDADGHGGRMLGELAAKVAKALIPLGFVQKAKFQPHLTVFRVKNKVNDTANVLKRFENTEFGMQKVDAIKLKSSVLSSSGPTYGDLMVVGAKK